MSDTSLVAPTVGLSCHAFGRSFGLSERTDMAWAVHHALDLGVSPIVIMDSREGMIERLVGQTIVGRHEDMTLATQVGCRWTASGRMLSVDGRPEAIKAACDESLTRLGVDNIGLYFLSQADPHVPLQDSVGAIAELVTAGKVRGIGLPALPAGQLAACHAIHPISAVIGEYSLCQRQAEQEQLAAARELGIRFLARSPLGRGFLTGRGTVSAEPCLLETQTSHDTWRDGRPDQTSLRRVEEVAARRDTGVARLALAWLLAQGPNVIPVPSARGLIHVEMNAAATQLRLSEGDLAELAGVFPAPRSTTR